MDGCKNERFLVILEVSQKQAYIFGSNKVADNIVNSAVIAKCLSPEYIETVLGKKGYNASSNMVYSGGGHTILEYDDLEKAQKNVFFLTQKIYKDFGGLSVFAKIHKYDDAKTPKENLEDLTAELERKKAVRRSGFHHGSFGIEKIDPNTLKPECVDVSKEKNEVKEEEYKTEAENFTPDGYKATLKFEDLGGEKNKTNFIAVIHIDGNGMGKRVTELYDLIGDDWSTVKGKLKEFSDCIDTHFKDAYREMTEEIKNSLESGKLRGKLKLKVDQNGDQYFPVRRIITAGDDICFVSEGRIGLECARIFIQKLCKKTNIVDNKGYSACAGVAIVHQKYPFYRAYELAESLCSKAKKAGAELSPDDDGRNVCSIDWHIEFGELKDSIDEIERDYIADDKSILTYRPYVVEAEANVMRNIPIEKQYAFFSKNMERITAAEKKYGDGKIKNLRQVIKKGKTETENYVKFYKLEDMNATYDSNGINPMFDAIEMMDTFLFV